MKVGSIICILDYKVLNCISNIHIPPLILLFIFLHQFYNILGVGCRRLCLV